MFLDGLRRFVFVKTAAGAFTRRGVRVGPSLGETLPVLAGLTVGGEVVLSGALYLQQMLVEAGTRAAAIEPDNAVAKK